MTIAVALGLAVVLAYFIGAAAERTRDAHGRWVSYRSRAVTSLRAEVSETIHTILWVAALVFFLFLLSRF